VHAGGRRRGKGQRLLYWFRTPPGVRVGRSPIDEDAIRLLEQHNPDVEFDWTRILKDPPPAEPPRREARPPRDGRDRRREDRPRPRPSEPVPAASAPPVPVPEFVESPDEIDAEEGGMPGADESSVREEASPPLSYVEEAAAQLESIEPEAAGEAEEPGGDPGDEDVRPFAAPPLSADEGSASYQRLGAEGLGRLRARYAEVMARITEQSVDDEAKEQLKARAERLNPDGWVTADEVAAALEQYEVVFEELRALVGRDPRRHRRRRR
jgi:hypothetical protein